MYQHGAPGSCGSLVERVDRSVLDAVLPGRCRGAESRSVVQASAARTSLVLYVLNPGTILTRGPTVPVESSAGG